MSEFSVSPSDLADELSDCKRIEQDNGPDSPGAHSSIVSDRCLVIIGILSGELWCLNRHQSTAVDREEFYHSKRQKAFLKVSKRGPLRAYTDFAEDPSYFPSSTVGAHDHL